MDTQHLFKVWPRNSPRMHYLSNRLNYNEEIRMDRTLWNRLLLAKKLLEVRKKSGGTHAGIGVRWDCHANMNLRTHP